MISFTIVLRLLCLLVCLTMAEQQQYSVVFIGGLTSTDAKVSKLAVNFTTAEVDPTVMKAKREVATNASLSSMQRLKQSLLAAQEKVLPQWARWKPFRPSSPGNVFEDDGSFKDWKTSSEDDSTESLTWLNEFFHPAAFVKRAARQDNGGNRIVYYQDYDQRTGVPFDDQTAESRSTLDGLRRLYGNTTKIARISDLDQRAERLFFRKVGGPCLYSVPFFLEPLLKYEEGMHFFVSANGNLLATSYTPCDEYCSEYAEKDGLRWPGIYLQNTDLDPSRADRSIPPLDPQETGGTEEGFSGIWIDRYVYANAFQASGVATHFGTARNGVVEDLTDADRQVSVVVTYENIPTYGVNSKSNFTAQVELFTNGTIIMRYRSLGLVDLGNNFAIPNLNPSLDLGIFTQSARLRQDKLSPTYDQFNNTNMSSLPLVAVRFDSLVLGGLRSADTVRKMGRCLIDPISEAVIPAGHRSVSSLDCSEITSCVACTTDTGCVWCGNLMPTKAGVGMCLPSDSIEAFCLPGATYSTSCVFSVAELNNEEPARNYETTTAAVPDWRTIKPTVGLSQDVAQIMAATMRHGHPTTEYMTRSK